MSQHVEKLALWQGKVSSDYDIPPGLTPQKHIQYWQNKFLKIKYVIYYCYFINIWIKSLKKYIF